VPGRKYDLGEDADLPQMMQRLIEEYVEEVKKTEDIHIR
jgi:hypothetical protein